MADYIARVKAGESFGELIIRGKPFQEALDFALSWARRDFPKRTEFDFFPIGRKKKEKENE